MVLGDAILVVEVAAAGDSVVLFCQRHRFQGAVELNRENLLDGLRAFLERHDDCARPKPPLVEPDIRLAV
jgi:hypothetical protein